MSLIQDTIEKVASKKRPYTSFAIQFPDGKIKKFGPGKIPFTVQIKSSRVYTAAALKGSLGIGEQYMIGNLEIEGNFDNALTTLVGLFDANESGGNLAFQTLNKLKLALFPETKDKSLRDISAHYDISNEFYSRFLDPTMTYSCAYFKTEKDTLEQAQLQKYEHICRKLQLKKGESLIDVGCGWGGMLTYAAQRYGVHGYGVTLSENQFEYANEKIKKLKLDKQIKIELKDYRDITGSFDKFVSIGMFEHVTIPYYDQFFQKVDEVLNPGGIGVLHTLGRNIVTDTPMDPWITTYIFPGSHIPSAQVIFKNFAKHNLIPQDFENLHTHYALTLAKWAENYMKFYDHTVQERGEKFARMWKYYLHICHAGFVNGLVQLWQTTFTKGLNSDYPLTRSYLYTK